MSVSVHGLLHLPQCVQNLGPLWCHCFQFGNANGELLKAACKDWKSRYVILQPTEWVDQSAISVISRIGCCMQGIHSIR